MSMSMGMSFSMRQIQVCNLCGESVADHAESCPARAQEKLLENEMTFPCERKGCRGKVWRNSEDYYECMTCHTQFTTGMCVPGVDVEKANLEKTHLINVDRNFVAHVLVMPEKGKGIRAIDENLARIKEQIAYIRAQKKGVRMKDKNTTVCYEAFIGEDALYFESDQDPVMGYTYEDTLNQAIKAIIDNANYNDDEPECPKSLTIVKVVRTSKSPGEKTLKKLFDRAVKNEVE